MGRKADRYSALYAGARLILIPSGLGNKLIMSLIYSILFCNFYSICNWDKPNSG